MTNEELKKIREEKKQGKGEIPDGCDQVYIKPEENKAYWVKGDESGAVELW